MSMAFDYIVADYLATTHEEKKKTHTRNSKNSIKRNISFSINNGISKKQNQFEWMDRKSIQIELGEYMTSFNEVKEFKGKHILNLVLSFFIIYLSVWKFFSSTKTIWNVWNDFLVEFVLWFTTNQVV